VARHLININVVILHRNTSTFVDQQIFELCPPSRYFNEGLSDAATLLGENGTNEDDASLNVLRVRKYTNNSRLKQLARDNMPFMGLEVHGLDEIRNALIHQMLTRMK
jgi:hypothetical protein